MNNLLELAQNNFKRFVATLYKLSSEDGIKFDTIIVGGNTGLSMARFTQMFYEVTGLNCPNVLKITPQRYKPGTTLEQEKPKNLFDNSILIHDVKNQIRDYKLKNIQNILFVDDEIYLGTTAKACIDILANIFSDKQLSYTVIAEDSGFEAFPIPNNVQMQFIPFSKEIDGFYNVIMSIIPSHINASFEKIFPDEEVPFHKRINILLNLPTRDKNILLSGFNYSLNAIAKDKIPNLEKLQREFESYLTDLIQKGIEEYSNGIIDLNDYSYRDKYI